MKTKSDKFIQGVTNELSAEFMRFHKDLTVENSMRLSSEIVSRIDWENDALMHKGLGWIAKNYPCTQSA